MDGAEFRSPPKRIILGDLNQNGGSPVSPMANLKLLTKVATSHFPVGENREYEPQMEKSDSKCDKPSRRLRSLSFICKKFLSLYKLDIPAGNSQQFSLGNLALSLGIEKRRVYDIINVVSSLHMAVRVCKDKYNWLGNQNLPILLSQLKAYALINKFDEQINTVLRNQLSYSSTTAESESPFIKITRGDRSVFEENRIGILCQKFIMLFLVSDQEIPLNMCTISKLILTGDVQDKTGMRRLYDIANVLEALDLIKRYNCKIMKKPSFKYCGPAINVSRNECEKLLPKEFSTISQINEISDQGDTNSDSSLDCVNTSKLDSILEVVCTELEEENCLASTSPVSIKRKRSVPSVIQCRAKKQLFPSILVDSINMTNTFVRAPKRSFRLEFDELQVKESSDKTALPQQAINEEQKPSQPTVSSKNQCQLTNFMNNYNNLEPLEKDGFPNESKFEISVNTECQPEILPNLNNIRSIKNDESFMQNKNLVLRKIPNRSSHSIVPTKFKVLRPMKISDIQNGGIYKVLKKGNSVQLYALYD